MLGPHGCSYAVCNHMHMSAVDSIKAIGSQSQLPSRFKDSERFHSIPHAIRNIRRAACGSRNPVESVEACRGMRRRSWHDDQYMNKIEIYDITWWDYMWQNAAFSSSKFENLANPRPWRDWLFRVLWCANWSRLKIHKNHCLSCFHHDSSWLPFGNILQFNNAISKIAIEIVDLIYQWKRLWFSIVFLNSVLEGISGM